MQPKKNTKKIRPRFDPDNLLVKTVTLPASTLDKTIVASSALAQRIPDHLNPAKASRRVRDFWHDLGPGLTTGASDDDPSGIATYSQAGAQYGYHFLWLAPLTFPLMGFVQEMCARIGMITGRGLAANIRTLYSKKVLRLLTLLLFAANTFNIGANLGAIAQAVRLLLPAVPTWSLVVFFAVLSLSLQIFTPYPKYARYLKYLALILLSYVVSALLAHLDWGAIFHATITPTITFNKDTIVLICAILGTTISPYLFFWQTSQEVEEQIAQGKTTLRERQLLTSPAEIKHMRRDVWSGMFLSNLAMFFVIAACGGILYANGIHEITSAAQAAEALRPFAGNATYTLFALGIIGTGMLSIPVLAGSSSYAIAESLQLRSGLHRPLKQAYAFYGVIMISMLLGLVLNFVGLDPIKALIYSAVGNGIVAPFVLFFIVRLSSNKKVMGRWVNKPIITAIGWLTTVLMAVAGIAAIFAFL